VLEHEAGINAFAAGYSPSDAAVAVTRGALERLNRDELQGVIAHEFSHVLNGDMRLNIRLMGVLFGILVLGIIGRKVLEHSRGGRSSRVQARSC
jgi:Zn-dependent protease with chaperone function